MPISIEGVTMHMRNFYECPNCGTEWEDTWDCACNDQCPECGAKDIEPYDSQDLSEPDND
ncbi:hypothetical protein VPH49_21785 [Pseudomonas luteola]|uniref:hypothetical protein n=1 Tax=Pseudomonas luteola TaxID=47886 RepID=UPI003A83FFF4